MRLLLVLAPLVAFASGCTPTCRQVCKQITQCEQIDDWTGGHEDLCVENCLRQEAVYDAWDDTQLLDALDATKVCLMESTCEEVEDGRCYDQDLYPF